MAERVSSIFFDAFNHEIENNPNALGAVKGPNRDWAMAYFMRNIMAAVEIDSLQDEIELVLSRIGVEAKGLLFSTLSIEELIVGLKFYLVSWSTMKDLMAMFINSVLDLGIAEKDISFGMILRNNKVQETRIPQICKKHAKPLKIGRIVGARNDAVHRGKLTDPDVNELRNKRNRIHSERYSLFLRESERMSEGEYEQKMREFHKDLAEIVPKKKGEYSAHYEETVVLNSEIAVELATIIARYLNDEKI